MCCKAQVDVQLAGGLHLRPAARIGDITRNYPGEIRLCYEGRRADAQSLLELLSLGVPHGASVVVEADRFDAPEVIDQIRSVLSNACRNPSA